MRWRRFFFILHFSFCIFNFTFPFPGSPPAHSAWRMRPQRLFWKLFLIPLAIGLVLIGAASLLISNWQRELILEQARSQLHSSAVMLRSRIEQHLPSKADGELQQMVQELSAHTHRQMRITVISETGAVLADSHRDPRVMENHAGRPEIQQAQRVGEGISERFSGTLDRRMLYVALPVGSPEDPRGFVRVAFDLATLDAEIYGMQRALWALVAVVALAGTLLGYLVVRRTIRPLEELTQRAQLVADGDEKLLSVPVHSRDELGRLAVAFNGMQRTLAHRLMELHDNHQRLQIVLGNMVEGVIAVGVDERILLANEASRRLLDFATAVAVGRPLLEVTRSLPLYKAFRDALTSGQPSQSEFEAVGKVRRVVALRATRLSGDPCPGVVLVLHDISELRRLENMRRDLVANVSHELKTPLSSIKAYAETLRLGAINDPQHNAVFVMRIEEQAERLHELILDMLQIARIESGQEVFEITHVPVEAAVTWSVQQHQDLATTKSINLHTDGDGHGVAVLADEEGLRTILSNLVDNAIKYTPEEGRVSVRWRTDGTQVVIEVQDTGIGIPAQHQSRIFERFYRVDRARSRELGGTGLGLSIVKHLAQAFGGKVGVESQPGQGSTFRVVLPRG